MPAFPLAILGTQPQRLDTKFATNKIKLHFGDGHM
jgi:hypothetical protein